MRTFEEQCNVVGGPALGEKVDDPASDLADHRNIFPNGNRVTAPGLMNNYAHSLLKGAMSHAVLHAN